MMQFSGRPQKNLARWLGAGHALFEHGARLGADLLYPPRCTACQAECPPQSPDSPSVLLCESCLVVLAPVVTHWCQRCSAPALHGGRSPEICPHCRNEKFAWRRAVALGAYRGELGKAILRIKRPRSEALATALAKLLAFRRDEALKSLACDVVVPVPMHWLRRWRRGMNAPDVIAHVLAERLNIACAQGALVRRRLTPLQVDSSRVERKANQRRSFRVSPGFDFRNRKVLLVDDVLTTGATTHSAARVLRKAGAAEVCVAVLARAGIEEG